MAFDLGGVLSPGAGQGGFSMPSGASGSLSDRSPINIAPIGANLGEILQPVSQGGPENGGIGADFLQRYTGGGQSPGTLSTGVNWPLLIAIPGAILALFILMRKRRG